MNEDVYEDERYDAMLAEDDGYAEWLADAYQAQWDDDPSPYDGNYSEM